MGVPFLILNIITFLPSWTQTKLQMEADSKYIHIFFPIQSVFFFLTSLMETLHFHSFIHNRKDGYHTHFLYTIPLILQ